MSDKIIGFTVIFKNAVSEEYMDKVKQAVELFDGVVKVESVVQGMESFISASAESHRIKMFIIDCVKNNFGEDKK